MDFLLNVVALPADREPDWDAAARRIAALGLEDLDRFFGYWDHDGAAGGRPPTTTRTCRD
ncbi:MAG: hypothetical protein H0V71_07250 [Chloroflexi bacterium]|nr:hypothetical protein [Chloroflexota bacterium]